jgi:hypothetical protein
MKRAVDLFFLWRKLQQTKEKRREEHKLPLFYFPLECLFYGDYDVRTPGPLATNNYKDAKP